MLHSRHPALYPFYNHNTQFTTISERASLDKTTQKTSNNQVVSVNFKISKFGWRLNRQLIFPIQR